MLGNHVFVKQLGEVATADGGFVLQRDPDVLVAPDVAFIAAQRLTGENDEGFYELAPDLAVEILSPSDRASDINAKVTEYLRAGTRLVWLVDLERRTVTVYTPDQPPRVYGEQQSLSGGDVLPGFQIELGQLFTTTTGAGPTR